MPLTCHDRMSSFIAAQNPKEFKAFYYRENIFLEIMLDVSLWFSLLFQFFRQTLPAVAATELSNLKVKAEHVEIIGIDEGQFVSTQDILNYVL